MSMNPGAIPLIKDFVRKVRFKDAREILRRTLEMEDTAEIAELLGEAVDFILENS